MLSGNYLPIGADDRETFIRAFYPVYMEVAETSFYYENGKNLPVWQAGDHPDQLVNSPWGYLPVETVKHLLNIVLNIE